MTNTTVRAGASAPAAGRRSRTKQEQPTGTDRIPRPSQGWYRVPGTDTKLRRVTTILSQGSTKGDVLSKWAANLVAEVAMANLPRLVSSSLYTEQRAETYDWLRRAPLRKRDERADIGSAVHSIIEAHVLGMPVPEDLLNDLEMAPYLAHFLRFVDEWQVTFEASEMVVGSYEHGYAGTLDYLLKSPLIAGEFGIPASTVLLGDTKTGGELDVKGVYPEAALQMAAYRKADVAWLRDGTNVPMPATHDRGVVLHLRPEGYRLIPIACGDDVFAQFRITQQAAEWISGLSKTVVGEALALPTAPEERAA
ncbi:hypothetical protein [Streptomyces violascens]|uniref:Uncharacterized protein n=1 Tax=Streptomyces violascens TaxID=67381 RepID=A0ABQ3QX74_9ACTN|nr:hypothetical protein [Streptomyces violascens]GGU12955.1 hypothetical protein GCM10010289_38230 [Streptomyces violascens]GHI41873.1 hypothetical protein Sviol_62810 [Streptomyces violascens]